MTKVKFAVTTSLLILGAAVLPGCKYAKRFINKPKLVTLVLGFQESNISFDWQHELNAPSTLAVTHLMDGLVDYQKENGRAKVTPALAESWESKSESSVWIFRLRKTQWSDGEELRAEQFINSFKRLLAPETESPFAGILYSIKNAKEFHEGKTKFFSEVGIKSPDSHTLIFELTHSMPLFPEHLAHYSLYPVRNDLLELFSGRKKKIEQIPWVGPYRLILLGKRRIQLFENKFYQRAHGNIQKVDFLLDNKKEKLINMMSQKKIDIAFDLESQPPLNSMLSMAAPMFSYYQLVLGCNQKPLRDPILRRVIALSINKEELARNIQGTQSLGGVVPPGIEGYESNRGMKYDAEMAALVLKNAKMEHSLSKFSYDLYLDKTVGGFGASVGEVLKEQLRKNLGMEIKIQPHSFGVERKDFDKNKPYLILEKVYGVTLHPYLYLTPYSKPPFQTLSGWKNRNFEEFSKRALTAKAQHLLVEEENPVIPLFSTYSQMLAQSNIQGLEQNFMRLVDFRNLIIDKK